MTITTAMNIITTMELAMPLPMEKRLVTNPSPIQSAG